MILITRTQTVYRRHDEIAGAQVGQAVPFYIPRFFIPRGFPAQWGRIERSAIVDRIERNIVTLRVLIEHEVVRPGSW